MNASPRVRWLGRMEFGRALSEQERVVARKQADPLTPDEFLLLEHEPVYTIGRTPDQSSLRGASHLPYPLFPINRGGQATYHGPGQLMVYPIMDLHRYGRDLHRYLRWLEQLILDLLADYEINGQRRAGLTGVWIGPRKIASIGVGVRRWITMHGFALNVTGDLAPFREIVPCGIRDVAMTSIEKETGTPISVIDVAAHFEKMALTRLAVLGLTREAQTANA